MTDISSPGKAAAAPSAARLTWLTIAWIALVSVLRDYDEGLAEFSSLTKLDLQLGYGADYVQQLFVDYGKPGQTLYRQLTFIDQLFAVVVGLWGAALAKTVTVAPVLLRRLIRAAPWAFTLLDILENLAVLRLLNTPEQISVPLTLLSSTCTGLKLVSLAITYLTALYVAGRAASATLLGRRPALHVVPLSTSQRRVMGFFLLGAGIALSAIQSRIWNGPGAPGWIVAVVPDAVAEAPGAYERFGRLFLALPLGALVLLPAWSRARGGGELLLTRLLFVLLLGDFATYWLFGSARPELRAFSFWGVEVPGWCFLMALATVRGVRAWRDGDPPAWRRGGASAQLLLLPLVVLSVALVQYLPHAFVLPVLLIALVGGSPWGRSSWYRSQDKSRAQIHQPRSATLLAGLIALVALCASCSSFAVATAPKKKPVPAQGKTASDAVADFWRALHGGDYASADEVAEQLTAAYLQHPRDPKLPLLLAHTHFWQLVERKRLPQVPAQVTDHMLVAEHYFEEAERLSPQDLRITGWLGGLRLAIAKVHDDERLRRAAYFELRGARDQWPEFNGFSFGYALTQADNPKRVAEAVDAFWLNLDECADENINRNSANYGGYRTTEGDPDKRVCENSWIAPHGFEGFFLAMGDALLKQGQAEVARRVMRNALFSADYAAWPFRRELEARIATADERAAAFMDDDPANDPELMVQSSYGCTGCHQAGPEVLSHHQATW